MNPNVTFSDISEQIDDSDLPFLDRADVDESMLTLQQQGWRRDGVLVLKDFLPYDLIDPYYRVREKLDRPGGWKSPVPYMQVPQIRDLSLYRPLMSVLSDLIGEEMGLHLNLTGWVSTERNWHQDDYLNPPFVKSHYAAVWMALDDVHPDSGPFEFVRGSHKWPLTRREKIFSFLNPEQQKSPDWPTFTQGWVSRAFEKEIYVRRAVPEKFIAKKGDVLIWHGRLAHRGSQPNVPGMPRKALISHYSALSKRPDMPERAAHTNGQAYFVHNHPLE